MKEAFLHYVWKSKKFDFLHTYTTGGKKIEIIEFGHHNDDAGPDFLHAKIKIDDTLWAGHVEIHVKASDWYKHNHHLDEAYNNVILHVVWEEDKRIINPFNCFIPCLELKERVNTKLLNKYENLMANNQAIACEQTLNKIDNFVIDYWLQRLTVERLENKVEKLQTNLIALNFDWDQLLFEYVGYCFGLKTNAEAFQALSRSISIQILRKHTKNIFLLEALLFGQAGLLSSKFKDYYAIELLKEYTYLKHKYNLTAISRNWWKFSRMRPANFPTLRIAQLSCLLSKKNSMLSFILENDVHQILSLFSEIQASEYWNNHYLFDKESILRIKILGENRVRVIMINAIVPILFTYGYYQDEQKFKNKAINILEMMKSEDNKIIKMWKSLSIHARNASDSQALIFLKKQYCDEKKCLDCSIGHSLFSVV